MARPYKYTVEYFPHYCKHKQTMFIIEKKYGNIGYAFWFKLLELIGDSPGHYINCKSLPAWEYLLSYTSVDQTLALDILKSLSELNAIDKELWEHQLIWVVNFVEGVADVYKRRQMPIPTKPSLNGKNNTKQNELMSQKIYNNPMSDDINVNNNPMSDDVNVNINTQSKVKQSKVKQSIYSHIFNHWNSCKIIKHKTFNKLVSNKIDTLLKEYSKEEICKAISNYAEILNSNDKYWFNYRWTLVDFLQRGATKFMDNASPFQNYLRTKIESNNKPIVKRIIRDVQDVLDNER